MQKAVSPGTGNNGEPWCPRWVSQSQEPTPRGPLEAGNSSRSLHPHRCPQRACMLHAVHFLTLSGICRDLLPGGAEGESLPGSDLVTGARRRGCVTVAAEDKVPSLPCSSPLGAYTPCWWGFWGPGPPPHPLHGQCVFIASDSTPAMSPHFRPMSSKGSSNIMSQKQTRPSPGTVSFLSAPHPTAPQEQGPLPCLWLLCSPPHLCNPETR